MGAWTEFYRKTTPYTYYPDGSPHGYAVVAIKTELMAQGFGVPGVIPTTAVIGNQAEKMIKNFQKDRGLTADGVVGPATAKALFKKRVFAQEAKLAIPNHYLCKMLSLESDFDPGATGSSDPRDRGLAQINSYWHPDVTDKEAFDPAFSITWAAEALRTAYNYLHDWDGAIASHNAGLGSAKIWLKAGKPAGKTADYVALVKGRTC